MSTITTNHSGNPAGVAPIAITYPKTHGPGWTVGLDIPLPDDEGGVLPTHAWGGIRVWVDVLDGRLVIQVVLDPSEDHTFQDSPPKLYLDGHAILPHTSLVRPLLWLADCGRPIGALELVIDDQRRLSVELGLPEAPEAVRIRQLKAELKGAQRALADRDSRIRELEGELAAAVRPPEHPLVRWLGRGDGRAIHVHVNRVVTTGWTVTLTCDRDRYRFEGFGMSVDAAIADGLRSVAALREERIKELREKLTDLESDK